MKITIFSFALAIATTLISCTRADNSSSTSSQVITSGNWKVSSFIDSGNDETTDFAGYSFVFAAGGSITVTKNSISQNGTWNIDNSSNKFNIDLGPKNTAN